MAKIAIDQIEATAATQVRVKIDQGIVDEYAEAIEAGEVLPAIIVFVPKNSMRYILADGFHRLAACVKLGRKTIGVEVKEGELNDALRFALGANSRHGLKRSSADKRHAVEMALKDPNYDKWSLRELGELCRVSHQLVSTIKQFHNQTAKQIGEKETKTANSSENVEAKPRQRRVAPTQEQTDRKELLGALATIKSFPYDGQAAYARLEMVSMIDDLKFAADWINEALDEHEAAENGPEE